MKYIDLNTWDRKEHFVFFHRMDYPQYNVCFNIDITDFISVIKKEKISFYFAMIYFSTLSANNILEFKYRIRDDKIVLHDILNPSFTYMNKGEDLFKMVTVDMKESLQDFLTNTTEKAQNQTKYFMIEDFMGRDDFIYFTSLPWISFTHLSHTINLNKNDAVPRLSWGKYFEENGKMLLPYSVQVNHAFVDGFHVGRYKEKLEKSLNEFKGM